MLGGLILLLWVRLVLLRYSYDWVHGGRFDVLWYGFMMDGLYLLMFIVWDKISNDLGGFMFWVLDIGKDRKAGS
jgi:hypothetical protein